MEYKHARDDNFGDFACGRVIYNKPGMPNFPVRLTQEIFGRCLNYLKNRKNICIYDPCCGSGYMLTVLGFLNTGIIDRIIASDIDNEAVNLAKRNLSLLTGEGLECRIRQLNDLYEKFHKASHKEGIESGKRMMNMLGSFPKKPDTYAFQADLLSENVLGHQSFKADIVMTDVPYGNLVAWQGDREDGIGVLMENLIPVLKPDSVVAICTDKKQKIKTEKYRRLEKQLIGKRKFEIFALQDTTLESGAKI